MIIKFFIGLILSLFFNHIVVYGLAPTLYFNGKRVHHARIGLFYLFVLVPIFLIAWATNNINWPVMMGLAGFALGVFAHDVICHLFPGIYKKYKNIR